MKEGQKNEWKRQKKGVGGRDEETRRKMRQRWFCLFEVKGYKAGTPLLPHPLPVRALPALIQTQE